MSDSETLPPTAAEMEARFSSALEALAVAHAALAKRVTQLERVTMPTGIRTETPIEDEAIFRESLAALNLPREDFLEKREKSTQLLTEQRALVVAILWRFTTHKKHALTDMFGLSLQTFYYWVKVFNECYNGYNCGNSRHSLPFKITYDLLEKKLSNAGHEFMRPAWHDPNFDTGDYCHRKSLAVAFDGVPAPTETP